MDWVDVDMPRMRGCVGRCVDDYLLASRGLPWSSVFWVSGWQQQEHDRNSSRNLCLVGSYLNDWGTGRPGGTSMVHHPWMVHHPCFGAIIECNELVQA